MEKAVGMEVLSYLRGGVEVDVESVAKTNPEMLARCIMYLIARGGYHRERMCKALVKLINYAPPVYRGIAWMLIQEIPLSHLLYVTRVIEKNKENSRRLRHAIATKLALAPESEIIRAFFIAPKLYRNMFKYLKLPREVFNGNPIKSPAYRLAYRLSQLSTNEAFGELHLTPSNLLAYGVPLHMVMQYVANIHEAEELAYKVKPDDFFRHARWFRDILGDEKFEKIAMEKVKKVRDPISFLTIKSHLETTGAVTPKMTEHLERRATEVLEGLMRKYKLERLALIVDVSGSMYAAKEITEKLYEAFSRAGRTITDLIAFRECAFEIDLDRLRDLEPSGTTSIGSAIVLLAQRLKERGGVYPQAIVIVTDLGENTQPYLSDALPLLGEFNSPPLIVLYCGERYKLQIDYPHAIIPVDKFHPRLIVDIMRHVAALTAKVVQEKEITKIVKERRPIEEELGALKLPQRPKITYRKGFLEGLLCNPWEEKYWSWAVGS